MTLFSPAGVSNWSTWRRATRSPTHSSNLTQPKRFAPPSKNPIAFSILVNDVAGKVSGVRAAIDKCTEAIVRHLWRGDARVSEARRDEK